MRLRQQTDRQLGLGANGIESRCIQNHQALFEQWVRHVDQGVAPLRYFDQSVRPHQRVVVGHLVVPETQGGRFRLAHPAHLSHLLNRLGQLFRVIDIQINAFPLVGRIAPVQQRLGLQAGFNGQQPQARRHLSVIAQLGGTHGGAPGTGRHDAAPIASKKHRVDQLGLAARKLGHKGHRDLVVLDLRVQLLQPVAYTRFHQIVVGQPFRKQPKPQGKLLAPSAVLIKVLIEAHGPCSVVILQYSTGPVAQMARQPEPPALGTSGLRLLAVGAKKRGPLPLADAFDGRVAHPARQAIAPVHHGVQLEVAALPFSA